MDKLSKLGITYWRQLSASSISRHDCEFDCTNEPDGCDSDCDCPDPEFDCISDPGGCDSDCDD